MKTPKFLRNKKHGLGRVLKTDSDDKFMTYFCIFEDNTKIWLNDKLIKKNYEVLTTY